MTTRTIALLAPANEMVQEEILKQAAHVSRAVGNPRFLEDAQTIAFDVAPDADAEQVSAEVEGVARKIQRSLRSLG